MYNQQPYSSTIVRRSQTITTREDARELSPEEKLSPLDLEIYDKVIEKARQLPEADYWVTDTINEAARLGSNQLLVWVQRLNVTFPDSTILIPSDYATNLTEVELPDWLVPGPGIEEWFNTLLRRSWLI